jgi:hypothetical protein
VLIPCKRQLSTPSISLEPGKFFPSYLPLVGKRKKHFSSDTRFQRNSGLEVPRSQLQITRAPKGKTPLLTYPSVLPLPPRIVKTATHAKNGGSALFFLEATVRFLQKE